MQSQFAEENPKNTPLNLCLSNLSEKERNKVTILVNTAYFFAKEEMAFAKFENLCKLLIKHGIMCGANYLNDKGGCMFVHLIAQVMKDELNA